MVVTFSPINGQTTLIPIHPYSQSHVCTLLFIGQCLFHSPLAETILIDKKIPSMNINSQGRVLNKFTRSINNTYLPSYPGYDYASTYFRTFSKCLGRRLDKYMSSDAVVCVGTMLFIIDNHIHLPWQVQYLALVTQLVRNVVYVQYLCTT